MTEDEMIGWHHQLDGHEFVQAPGVGDGQGSLACCRPGDYKESEMTKQMNNRYADDTTLMAESEEELKSLLMRVKEESEKAGLKLNTQKTKIMASGPISSWQIDGGKTETLADFIFLGSKITMNGDCSHEVKRR